MSPPPLPPSPERRIARKAREMFVDAVDACMPELVTVIQQRFSSAADGATSIGDRQVAMDAVGAFAREKQGWVAAARRGWRTALDKVGTAGSGSQLGALGLVADEVVEQKILALRLSQAVHDKASWELNDLKIRIQRLEHANDMASDDVFRPEVYTRLLVETWIATGLTRPMWLLVQDSVREPLAKRMTVAYHQVNEYLIGQGVLPQIELKQLVRRTDGGGSSGGGSRAAPGKNPRSQEPGAGQAAPRGGMGGGHGPHDDYGHSGTGQAYGEGEGGYQGHAGGYGQPAAYGAPGGPQAHGGYGSAGAGSRMPGRAAQVGGAPSPRMGARIAARAERLRQEPAGGLTEIPPVRASALARAEQETRMMTGVTPMARIRQRAQGVLGQLRRMLTDRVADYDLAVPAGTVSPALASALAQPPTPFAPTQLLTERAGGATGVTAPVSVEVAAQQLRRRATELKAKANKSSEKAIIEIVALMFQAILAEERIPATLRVWFARLQIPVLRLALAEPDFFASTEHPARQLIDRMGACAMGFDAQGIAGTRLEREIKRIVQVIEQYPETGRRVFQLVFDEFKKFLGRSLTEGGATQHAVTLAQQVEQKEALAIQYTIELRKMLASMPVSDDVRDFLLHVWSEVLAMATVRHGPQHQTTLAYKRAAADVLWAISPKPDRTERSSVVQRLPQLLQALREGMATVGIEGAEQDGFVKQINDAVMQAFVSRGEGIAPEKLDELAQSLAGLEDIVPDDAEGDVLLDPDTLELMFGVDASSMKVIAAGGSQPGAGMLAWAAELELGNWFSLEFGGATMQVQYVWRSARGQLHLFAHAAGQTYLVQTTRLASYLQAGMLVPLEDEALTVRATRDALARLDATPDQLLH